MLKVKVTRLLNAVTKNEPYLRNWKAYVLTAFKLGTMTHITEWTVTSKVKGQGNMVTS